MSGSMKKNNMMSGGNARGGATGSITRTAIDAAPYIIPSDDPILLTNEESRSTVMGWLSDYDDITSENSYRASADLTWKISKKFSYNLRTGGNILTQDRSRWYGLQLFKGLNENGSLGLSNLNSNNYTVENLINFNHSAGKMLDISATAGVTYDDYNWVNKNTTASDFKFKDLRSNGLHMASIVNETQPIQRDYQLMSYLGRLNLLFYKAAIWPLLLPGLTGPVSLKRAAVGRTFPPFRLPGVWNKKSF